MQLGSHGGTERPWERTHEASPKIPESCPAGALIGLHINPKRAISKRPGKGLVHRLQASSASSSSLVSHNIWWPAICTVFCRNKLVPPSRTCRASTTSFFVVESILQRVARYIVTSQLGRTCNTRPLMVAREHCKHRVHYALYINTSHDPRNNGLHI